jgi:hypothetical protein
MAYQRIESDFVQVVYAEIIWKEYSGYGNSQIARRLPGMRELRDHFTVRRAIRFCNAKSGTILLAPGERAYPIRPGNQ